MPNDPKQLHIVQMPVDQRKLFLFAKSREIPLSRLDTGSVSDSGYILHCLFTEIFSPNYSPKPFAIDKAKGVYRIIIWFGNLSQKIGLSNALQLIGYTFFSHLYLGGL